MLRQTQLNAELTTEAYFRVSALRMLKSIQQKLSTAGGSRKAAETALSDKQLPGKLVKTRLQFNHIETTIETIDVVQTCSDMFRLYIFTF